LHRLHALVLAALLAVAVAAPAAVIYVEGVGIGGTTVTASITADEIQGSTCVAPCAVHYDATATDDTDLTREFHSLHYEVECGIADAAETPGTWAPTGNSRDYSYGAVGLCFYTEPGAYTMTLSATAPDGDSDTATDTVTVVAAEDVFDGSNETCCIANGATPSAGANGCPAEATIVADSSGDLDAVLNGGACDVGNSTGAKRAVYLRGGDTFTASATIPLERGDTLPGLITSYGTGQATIANTTSYAFTSGHGWTLHNLAYVPANDSTNGFINRPSNTAIDGVTLYDIDATGAVAGLVDANTGGAAGNKNTRWAIVGTTYNKTATTSATGCSGTPCTSLVVFGRFSQGHYKGNDWDINNITRNEFVTRSNGFDHGSITENRMEGAGNSATCSFSGGACSAATGYTCPLLNACTGGGTCTANVCVGGSADGADCDTCASNNRNPIQIRVDDSTPSEYNVVADNILGSNGSNVIRTTVDDEAGTGTVENQHTVFERNFIYIDEEEIPLADPTNMFQVQGGDFTIQSNVLDLTGIPNGGLGVVNAATISGTPTNDNNVHVYNNTIYNATAHTATDTYFAGCSGGTGCEAIGNLFYMPNKSGSETIAAAGYTTATDNSRDRQASGDNYTGCPFYGSDDTCDATCTLSAQGSTDALEFITCGTPITGGESPVDTGLDFSAETDGGPVDDFGRDLRTTYDKGAWD